MRAASFLVLVTFLCSCGSCEEDASQRPETTSPPPEPPAETSADDAAPIGSPEDGIDAARVRALLDGWLAAQNAGDFEAYSALYAERFEGVKRSGERTYRYGREPWLEDRRRMFARPMQVSAEDIRISSASEAAVIVFEQHWSAATYSDVGPKQLVLVERGDALLIGREEMLRSRIVGHGEVGPPPASAFMLVVDVGGPYVVLTTAVDESAGRGELVLKSRGRPATAIRPMDPAVLEESARALIGAEVEAFGVEGAACEGRIGAPQIVHRVVPHFGTVQHWNGEFEDPPRTEAQIAVDVWELGAAGAFIAAPLLGDGCERALWARVTTEVPAVVYTPFPVVGDALAAALRAFRAQPAHGAVQRDFRSYGPGHSGLWDAHDGASAVVYEWRDPASERSAITVRARVGAGCAEFFGALWGLFVDVDGALVARTDTDSPGDFEAKSIVDLDGDGLVEVIVDDGLLRASEDGGYTRVLDITPPYLDCDC